MGPITLSHKIAEIERELAVRRRVYPRWVTIGRITKDTADHRIAVLESLLDELKRRVGKQERLSF